MGHKDNHSANLGACHMSSQKPVILFDDFDGTCREFDTVREAVDARQKEPEANQWAALKMIFRFDASKPEYQLLTADSIKQAVLDEGVVASA